MAAVPLKIESKEFDRYLKMMRKNLGTLRPLFDSIEPILRTSIRTNFRMGGRPRKWAKLSAWTIATRKKEGTYPPTFGSGILFAHGTLMRKATTPEILKKTAKSMEFGTADFRASTLQYGKHLSINIPAHTIFPTKAKALRFSIKGVTVFAKSAQIPAHTLSVNIPARPFIMFQKDDIKAITYMAMNYAFDPERTKAVFGMK